MAMDVLRLDEAELTYLGESGDKPGHVVGSKEAGTWRTAARSTSETTEASGSKLVFPLKVNGRVVGMVRGSRNGNELDKSDPALLEALGRMIGTALSQARELRRIRGAELRWRKGYDSTTDGIALVGADHTILRVNSAFASLFDKAPEQLHGKPCYQVMHDLEAPPSWCPLNGCDNGGVCRADVIRRRSGESWMYVRHDLISDPSGQSKGIVITIPDAGRTDRRRLIAKISHKLSRIMSLDLSIDAFLGLSLDSISALTGQEACTLGVALIDREDASARIVSVRGFGRKEIEGLVLPLSTLGNMGFNSRWPRTPQIFENLAATDSSFRQLPGMHGLRTLVVMPIVAGRHAMGALFVGSVLPQPFSAEVLEALETWARNMGIALQNIGAETLADKLLDRAIKGECFFQQMLCRADPESDVTALCTEVARAAAQAMGVDMASVMLCGEDRNLMTVIGRYSETADLDLPPLGATLKCDEFPFFQHLLLHQKRPLIWNLASLSDGPEKCLWEKAGVQSVLSVPILVGDAVVGAFNLGTCSRARTYSPLEVLMAMAVAGHLSYVLKHDQLRKRLKHIVAEFCRAMEDIDDGAIAVTAGSEVRLCNKAAAAMFELGPSEISGRSATELRKLMASHCVDPEQAQRDLERLFSSHVAVTQVFKVAGRKVNTIECIVFPLVDDNWLFGTLAIFRDAASRRPNSEYQGRLFDNLKDLVQQAVDTGHHSQQQRDSLLQAADYINSLWNRQMSSTQ